MTDQIIKDIIEKQRAFYNEGKTLSVDKRIRYLKRLRKAVQDNERAIEDALFTDLGKSREESYMCEVGLALSEISYLIKNTKRFAGERCVMTPIAQFASRSFVSTSPYGNVLIMSPWNYPFLLTIEPLADAIAAGNTAVVKPSAYSPATSKVMKDVIEEVFPSKYVKVVTGGRQENSVLLEQKWDMIFFTGSQAVGKEVLRHAAEYLTPAVLELGGKSPCIVDETADLELAAKRIVFGKYLNCGQTCVAPDHIICQETVKDKLIDEMKKQIIRQYGNDPLSNPSYGKIVNDKHFKRILSLIDSDKIALGGKADAAALKIEPTILDHVTDDDPVMGEEIFGPVMPVLTYSRLEEIPERMADRMKPLAFYIFSSCKENQDYLLDHCRFGGGCINDTIIHLATPYMPFGGVGESGMGCYHGKEGFRVFSHERSIVDKKTWMDLPMRYQPYNIIGSGLIKIFLR